MVQKRNISHEIILGLLKHKKLHLRALSTMINTPHSTVYREVKALKKRGTLEYESIGRNRFASIKKGMESMYEIYQAEYYRTSRFIESNQEFSILAERILDKTSARLIIIFGSYAKGTEKKTSDIDIYINTENRKTRDAVSAIDSKLNIKIGGFDRKTPLAKEILRDHIILRGVEFFYEKNPIFD